MHAILNLYSCKFTEVVTAGHNDMQQTSTNSPQLNILFDVNVNQRPEEKKNSKMEKIDC